MRRVACVAAIGVVFALFHGCRSNSYEGLRCGGFVCPAPLVCRADGTPDGVLRCLAPLDDAGQAGDAGADAGVDAGPVDAGVGDAGALDGGEIPDAGGGAWGAVRSYGPYAADVVAPRLAISPAAVVYAAWVVSDGGDHTIAATRSFSGDTWDLPRTLAVVGLAGTGAVEVAALGDSSARLAWVETSTRSTIVVGSYSFEGVFDAGTVIDLPPPEDSASPKLARDGSGYVMAAWLQGPDGGRRVTANRHNGSQGTWAGSVVIGAADGGDVSAVAIEMNLVGTAVAVWTQTSGVGQVSSMWANRFDGQWGDAGQVGAPSGGESDRAPAVVVAAGGQAVVVWSRGADAPALSAIWSNQMSASGNWSNASTVDNPSNGRNEEPRVVMGVNGSIDAVWVRDSISVRWSPTTFDGGAWSPSTVVHAIDAGTIANLRFARDESRRLVAVWDQGVAGSRQVWMSEKAPSAMGWNAVTQLGTGGTDEFAPDLVSDSSGNLTVIWMARAADGGALVNIRQRR